MMCCSCLPEDMLVDTRGVLYSDPLIRAAILLISLFLHRSVDVHAFEFDPIGTLRSSARS